MLGLNSIPWANPLHLSWTPIYWGIFLSRWRGMVLHCYKAMSHRVATKESKPRGAEGKPLVWRVSFCRSSSKKMQEIIWPRCFSEEMRFPFKSQNHFLTSESDKPGEDPALLQAPPPLRYKASQCHWNTLTGCLIPWQRLSTAKPASAIEPWCSNTITRGSTEPFPFGHDLFQSCLWSWATRHNRSQVWSQKRQEITGAECESFQVTQVSTVWKSPKLCFNPLTLNKMKISVI